MKVRNASLWAPAGMRRWVYAAGALVLAIAVRLALHPLLGPVMPGTAFAIMAVLVEYYLGLAPALVVMFSALPIADFLFVPPYASLDEFLTFDRGDIVLLVSYPLVTLLVISLVERLRRAQFRARLITSVAQSRYEMLLRQDNDRLLARRAVDETHRLLRHLAQHQSQLILIKALERNAAQRAQVGQSVDAPLPFGGEVAPGPRYAQVHPDDIQRITHTLSAGSQRVRARSDDSGGEFRLTQCQCERFTTHAGDFLVLRVEEQG
ncbi:DUF4118 domain-containing protein [Burkholderia glumae]|uniref:DUF4118 domain-containing protein n=1 Tax=Burkholderia glumae TaxID=337 RepID=A0AAP9XWA8_BURGL|nr:DUF4118 domain-containing protein [Burkholderia glumae]ACR31776.1 Hypothetical protein bglu_2g14170 [Burkholderia glumae BGR1]KHJ62091.1 hypothetical protein NCPPB3923_15350 [Burkholderia glumae]MCM2485048.1 DUF4118 domain-containing protein [Burkholderia glumae]MCM2495401.1 DUF4118 domain-containing protein [Burkholderia glumae]MCM2510741.1 DUF4118 domain-containing protein [Burkholderia glumae]